MITDRLTLQGWQSDRLNLWFLLGLGLLVLGAGLGLRDPWPADEPRFALVAKQMVESGQWLFPFRGGEIYPDKPPMFMWNRPFSSSSPMRSATVSQETICALGLSMAEEPLARWIPSSAYHAQIFPLSSFRP